MLNGSTWDRMDEDEGFEEQLRSLVPGTHRVDRAVLMFRAGQAVGSRSRSGFAAHAWPAVSMVATLAAVALGTALLLEHAASRRMGSLTAQGEAEPVGMSGAAAPGAVPIPRPVPGGVLRPVQRAATASAPWARYAVLRDEVLSEGIEILPQPVSAPPARSDSVLSTRSWLSSELPGGTHLARPAGKPIEGGLL